MLLVLFIFGGQIVLHSQVIYVKQGSQGKGSSWKDAVGDLRTALQQAREQQEIWVAAGTYYPGNDRKAFFQIKNNIKLYGGFAGYERTRDERDWYKNLTILSGEIGAPGNADNNYTIIYTAGVSSGTIVDGFVISGAASNGASQLGNLDRSGGGWFNDGSRTESSPTIANCLFIDNFAREGAGLFNYANGGACRPRILDCQFINNSAHLEGGAIFNDGRNGIANPLIQSCYFLENMSNYGAVMRNLADGGESIAKIINSVFEANVSKMREIIYNGSLSSSKCKAVIEGSHFFNNAVSMGETGNNTSNFTSRQGFRKEGEIKYLVY